MIAIAAIAIAAGCASALMFASIISGALISLVLFYLAPLPLMVASIGWGPLSAAMGGIAAASTLGVLFGMPYGIAFALTVALPAWWLGHLVMLGRPVANAAPSGNGATPAAPAMEWYPTGRLLLWIAVFAVVTTMAALLTLGTDTAAIAASMKRGFLRILGPRDARRHGRPRTRHRCLRNGSAGRSRPRRDADADCQSMARRQDHEDLRPAPPFLARPARHRLAADDVGRAVRGDCVWPSPAECLRCRRRSSRPRCWPVMR